MEKYAWSSVGVNDWVRLKRNNSDGHIEGTVGSLNMGYAIVAGVTVAQKHYSVVGYRAGYKDGDIGLHRNSYGDEFVGIYDSKRDAFFANSKNTTALPQFKRGDGPITIIGNTSDGIEDEWI